MRDPFSFRKIRFARDRPEDQCRAMMQQKTMTTRAWIEMSLLALIWGASFLSNRIALTEMGVLTAVAFRVAGAAVFLWAFVIWRGYDLPQSFRIWAAFLAMGLLNNVLPFSLINWGQLTIPSGLAGILNASTAIFGVIVAAAVFRDERLTARKLTGVTVGFAGVATVLGLSALAALDLTSLSQLAIVSASLSYALAGAFGRVTLGSLRPEVAAAGMLTGSSLIMIPMALVIDGPPSPLHSAEVWGALAYLAVFATALAYLLYYRLLRMVGSGNLLLTTLLITPFAIVLGAVFFDEVLPLRAYAGFALMALGLVILDGRMFRRHRSSDSSH
jgi:drug/metabolite transporter (DMT)-like permease